MASPRLLQNPHSLLAGVPLLAFLALLGILLLASAANVKAANIHLQTDSEGWHRGRATYFGASPELVETFERVRGAGSYGDLHYGSCGMYRKPQVRVDRVFFREIGCCFLFCSFGEEEEREEREERDSPPSFALSSCVDNLVSQRRQRFSCC